MILLYRTLIAKDAHGHDLPATERALIGGCQTREEAEARITKELAAFDLSGMVDQDEQPAFWGRNEGDVVRWLFWAEPAPVHAGDERRTPRGRQT
jgi:hypothetical protein